MDSATDDFFPKRKEQKFFESNGSCADACAKEVDAKDPIGVTCVRASRKNE